jgi:hypothetical protein
LPNKAWGAVGRRFAASAHDPAIHLAIACVAAAGRCPQSRSVENGHLAAPAVDQVAALEVSGNEGVTTSAGRLQELGLINYRRGHITVLDRPGLERYVGDC